MNIFFMMFGSSYSVTDIYTQVVGSFSAIQCFFIFLKILLLSLQLLLCLWQFLLSWWPFVLSWSCCLFVPSCLLFVPSCWLFVPICWLFVFVFQFVLSCLLYALFSGVLALFWMFQYILGASASVSSYWYWFFLMVTFAIDYSHVAIYFGHYCIGFGIFQKFFKKIHLYHY